MVGGRSQLVLTILSVAGWGGHVEGQDEAVVGGGATHMVVPWLSKEHAPTLYGTTVADGSGLHFGAGEHYGGDFAAVHTPVDDDHLQGSFTIVIWGRKTTCESGGIYEYLFSEASGSPGDSESERSTSWGDDPVLDLVPPWISAYIGCERHGSGFSSLGGTILRYLLEDNDYHEYFLDVPLATEGAFDGIAGVWQHHVLTVAPSSLTPYLDGVPQTAGFFQGQYAQNQAHPDPRNLEVPVGSFVGIDTIVLGARHDLDPNRYYHGTIGLVALFDSALTAPEVLALSMSAVDEPTSLRPHVCCSAVALSHLAANNTANPFLWQEGLDRDGSGNVTWWLVPAQAKHEDHKCSGLSYGMAWILCEGVGHMIVVFLAGLALLCGTLCWTRHGKARRKAQAGQDSAPREDGGVVHAVVVVESPVPVARSFTNGGFDDEHEKCVGKSTPDQV